MPITTVSSIVCFYLFAIQSVLPHHSYFAPQHLFHQRRDHFLKMCDYSYLRMCIYSYLMQKNTTRPPTSAFLPVLPPKTKICPGTGRPPLPGHALNTNRPARKHAPFAHSFGISLSAKFFSPSFSVTFSTRSDNFRLSSVNASFCSAVHFPFRA